MSASLFVMECLFICDDMWSHVPCCLSVFKLSIVMHVHDICMLATWHFFLRGLLMHETNLYIHRICALCGMGANLMDWTWMSSQFAHFICCAGLSCYLHGMVFLSIHWCRYSWILCFLACSCRRCMMACVSCCDGAVGFRVGTLVHIMESLWNSRF